MHYSTRAGKAYTELTHPYFSSSHWKETVRETEKKLVRLGYSEQERKVMHRQVREKLLSWLTTGQAFYINGVLYTREGLE